MAEGGSGDKGKAAGKIDGFTVEKLHRAVSPRVLENASELVGAEFIIKRYRDGNEISAAFAFHGQTLHCTVTAKKYALQDLCTCDAHYFCRHAAALVMTFLETPDSFLDLESFLDELDESPKGDLVDMLRTMIGRYPGSSLEVLGYPGFQPSEVLDDPDDDFYPDDLDDDLFPDDDDWDEWDDDDDDDDDDDEGPNGAPVN